MKELKAGDVVTVENWHRYYQINTLRNYYDQCGEETGKIVEAEKRALELNDDLVWVLNAGTATSLPPKCKPITLQDSETVICEEKTFEVRVFDPNRNEPIVFLYFEKENVEV